MLRQRPRLERAAAEEEAAAAEERRKTEALSEIEVSALTLPVKTQGSGVNTSRLLSPAQAHQTKALTRCLGLFLSSHL